MKRLLKKEIKLVPVKLLNMRYCRILKRAETMDAKDIPIADANEILWIEDELRRRLIKYVGHDFYPLDRVEKKTPSNYMISLLTKAKSELKSGIKIKFRVVVKSSIGSKVAEFSVNEDSKFNADIQVLKMIRKLGLKGVTYKLS